MKTSFVAAALALGALATPVRSAPPPTPFPVQHGVNIPQLYARTRQISGSPTAAPQWEFTNWTPSYTPAELHAQGFDFVRLPVDPVALLVDAPVTRERLLSQVDSAIVGFQAQRLRVMFDLHFWSTPSTDWTAANVAFSQDPTILARYQQMLVAVARHLARFPQGQVALEFLNEPPHCVDSRWFAQQAAMIRAVRAVAPRLPLVVTGCTDGLDDTIQINATNTPTNDANLIYTFHFYDPFHFTHQGSGTFPTLRGIPYPAELGSEQDARAQSEKAVDSRSLSLVDATVAKTKNAVEIAHYFQLHAGPDYLRKRLNLVSAWAAANGIPASKIIIGEFAAINWLPSDTPERKAMRLAWDRDVTAAADAHGFAWAFWTLPETKGPIFR